MANPQLDEFIQALFWKAAPWIVLGSVIGMALNWLKRKAKGRRHKPDAGPTTTRRVYTPFSSPPASRPPARASVLLNRPTRIPSVPARTPDPLRAPLAPTPTLTLDDMTWENFELLVAEIFRRKGFDVEISSGLGADGGKDLTLRRDGEVRLVQCKFLGAHNKVSVMAMREFYGLVVAEQAKQGIFITTGLYSRDAREFAEGKPIKLLGRAEIEELMASVALPGENLCNIQNWIRDFAAVANVVDPDCPRCRKPMKLRRGPTGRAFWGCSSYATTRCRGKRDARAELVQAFSV